MSETFVATPESEINSEKAFWDGILNSFDALSDVAPDDIDLFGEIDNLRFDDQEDALMKLFNYTVMVSVDEGTSSKLEAVTTLLRENGIIETE